MNKLRSFAELKHAIQQVIDVFNENVCDRVFLNFNDQMTACRDIGGGYMVDIIFKH